MNGYQLDKNHKLTLCRFDDFDKYAKVPDTYAPLEPVAYKQPVRGCDGRRSLGGPERTECGQGPKGTR